jgi:hypoxanthine phosphoribosyltransferase
MQQVTVQGKTFKQFISEEQIHQRIAELGAQITREYVGKDPLFLGVLNGSFLFAADLLKEVPIPCQISFVKLASYSGTQSSGTVNTLLGLSESLSGRHVIVLEDIIDTGLTLHKLLEVVNTLRPASVKVAALLNKPTARKADVPAHYIGFDTPDDFLLGYGLDLDGYGRNLKHIYKLQNSHSHA